MPQRFADLLDVAFQESAGGGDPAAFAQAHKLRVLRLGALHAIREGQLKAGVPVAFLKQVGDDRQGAGLPGVAVEQQCGTPCSARPSAGRGSARSSALYSCRIPLSLRNPLRQMPGGCLQEPRLEQGPEFEKLLNLLGRELGDDGAAVGMDPDQPLRLELHQRLADREFG